MKFSVNNSCPCGSNKKYKKCCKSFHDKIIFPKNSLELMKSRYSAYVVSNASYIIFTTHENNPDYSIDKVLWEKDILEFCKNTNFKKLEILDFIDEDVESFVTFKATLFQNENDVSFTEKSRFLLKDGRWLYVDGEFLN